MGGLKDGIDRKRIMKEKDGEWSIKSNKLTMQTAIYLCVVLSET